MRRLFLILGTLALLAGACGDDGVATSDTTTSSGGDVTTTEAGGDPTTTSGGGPIEIADLQQSVVKIKAEGTFAQPDGTAAFNIAGVGTGFLISEDGLAVTNNHVVTGAALLEVYVPGQDQPVNARILGTSECWDLAVIELSGGGYTPLTFREEPVTAGIEVTAAGYPWVLEATPEDVDYTLTRGIVSSTDADGETSWASIDSVLEHDARIRGGNSGGPLVDENLQVVGVNYAGVDEADQNFAITALDAQSVIERLAEGENVDYLGINGQAIAAGEAGIFVSSVESGSPADTAGIEPGDILISLEDLVLATDGTMSQYCDVLRTQGADSVMNIELYRPSLGLVLDGQINGDPIDVPLITETVIEEGGGTGAEGGDGGEPVAEYAYTTVTDDSGRISVSIPAEWSEVDGRENPEFGPSVWAAPSIQAWQETWDTPGIIVESAPNRPASDIPVLLQERSGFAEVCTDEGAEDYDDGFYAGTLQIYSNCGGTATYYVILAAAPVDADYLVRVEIQAVEPRDLEAADEALATFIANI